ncbi:MAG: 30S ribosomal protein S20 [Firmicutes bacterium]|nr:30S ribosomal protein S20 [Bacillota bacterium]
MPNIRSAFKRMKQSVTRRQQNRGVKSNVKNAIKAFYNSLHGEDPDEIRKTYSMASSVIDKAASKGVIHKRNAARKKSRLAKKINEMVS